MTSPWLRTAPVPLFLFFCLTFGGSVQWPAATLAIQLSAAALLAWALLGRGEGQERGEGLGPVTLWVLLLAWALVQLVPLPPSLWSALPGRTILADGYRVLGMALPWRPISFDATASWGAISTLIVPLAVFLALIRREMPSASLLVGSVLAATVLGALVGIMQALDGTQRFYPYPISDWSSASGLFANPNHMALLLLVVIPLAVGLGTERIQATAKASQRLAIVLPLAAVAASLAIVIPFNRSLAMAILGPPVVIASALIPQWGKREHFRRGLSILLVVTAVVGVVGTYLARDQLTSIGQSGFATRSVIWKGTLKEIGATFPVGTGLGTFERVYPLTENPAEVDATYVNHAHNDYLELVMEGGAPAVLLTVLFFLWWARRAHSDWLGQHHSEMGRAATVASGAILAHSFVDYPLRTPGIAALFAACLAMMVVAIRPRPALNPKDIRETRHVVLR